MATNNNEDHLVLERMPFSPSVLAQSWVSQARGLISSPDCLICGPGVILMSGLQALVQFYSCNFLYLGMYHTMEDS